MENILGFERDEEEDFYAILGCDELSSTEQINAEYKAKVLSCHPDKHPEDRQKAKEFELLQRAKDVLCDPEKREKYDLWRRAGIAMSYKQWCGLRDAVQTSMHWAMPKKECMLEQADIKEDNPAQQQQYFSRSTNSEAESPFTEYHPTGTTSKTEPTSVPWNRDPPSEMLRKFRNYEI